MKENLVLEKNPESTRGLLIVPGISSGPYGRLFDEVTSFAKQQRNYNITRVNSWDAPQDLENQTLQKLHQKITEAQKNLRENQCEETLILGKSFGGQLTH